MSQFAHGRAWVDNVTDSYQDGNSWQETVKKQYGAFPGEVEPPKLAPGPSVAVTAHHSPTTSTTVTVSVPATRAQSESDWICSSDNRVRHGVDSLSLSLSLSCLSQINNNACPSVDSRRTFDNNADDCDCRRSAAKGACLLPSFGPTERVVFAKLGRCRVSTERGIMALGDLTANETGIGRDFLRAVDSCWLHALGGKRTTVHGKGPCLVCAPAVD